MADRSISSLTALTAPASGDYLPIIDISEASATDRNKRITVEELLRGAPSGTAAAPGIAFESDDNTGIYSPGADQLALSTGGTGRLFVDASGRVGVGTSSPQVPFVVSASGSAGFEVTPGSAGASSGTLIEHYNRSTSAYTLVRTLASAHRFDVGTTEAARIDSSGRLLVGTSTTPTGSVTQYAKFFLVGNTGDSTASSVLALGKGSAASNGDTLGQIYFTDSTNGQYAFIGAYADAATGSGDNPGRLVFSTTADGASSPTERMRIASDGFTNLFVTANDGFQSRNSAAAGTTYGFFVGRHSAANTGDGTISYVVYTNGNVQNTNNSYGAISDAKLKENIVDANSQWDDLKALQVRNYNFKEGQTHTQIGLVAQEVELVSPGLVSESPDRDEEGNDLGTVTKSVNYSVLYMKAVKALQEAIKRIETLEAKVAVLEAQ